VRGENETMESFVRNNNIVVNCAYDSKILQDPVVASILNFDVHMGTYQQRTLNNYLLQCPLAIECVKSVYPTELNYC
jgi:hypothetical protein